VSTKISKTEEEWRAELTPEQYDILRRKGTERPFTGKYVHTNADGTYTCAACGAELFSSKTKFESGTGWPSFFRSISKEAVSERGDLTLGMTRVEANCGKCGSHLGHVFDVGPAPTGLRYCMNSVSLKIKEKDEKK
jgi:peptide-methionine (R)-S-oxide reductase